MSEDGGIPLFLRVADGNEQDKVVFGEIAVEYKSINKSAKCGLRSIYLKKGDL